MRRLLVVMIALLSAGMVHGSEKPGYYRFPSLHGNTIVFTAEGDLWSIGTEGGIARRITSHPGVESYAAISPDGNELAFSAEYEGTTEVYTMPTSGGVPRRLTFDGGARVVCWTPEGNILYATGWSTLRRSGFPPPAPGLSVMNRPAATESCMSSVQIPTTWMLLHRLSRQALVLPKAT